MKVIITKCKEYDVNLIQEKIEQLISDLKFKIPPKSKVLLKPNLLSAVDPSKAVTTHPEIVRAIVRILKKYNCKITISDSSSDTGNSSTNRAFVKTGMQKIADEEKVDIISFESTKQIKEKTKGKVLKEILKSELIKKSDIIINLPKMKTHSLAGMTGCVKNMFGALSGGQKQRFHYDYQPLERFIDVIIDIYEANKPTLNIMDAIVGMEGNGPGPGGTPKKVGYILASKNGYALDYIQQRIMGFKSDTPVIKQAVKRKLFDKTKIKIIGKYKNQKFKVPLSSVQGIKKMLPSSIVGFIIKQLGKKPIFNKKCTRCGECIKICPADALKMKDIPELAPKKCISCYCCHEVCRYSAIDLEPNLMGKMINKLAEFLKMT